MNINKIVMRSLQGTDRAFKVFWRFLHDDNCDLSNSQRKEFFIYGLAVFYNYDTSYVGYDEEMSDHRLITQANWKV